MLAPGWLTPASVSSQYVAPAQLSAESANAFLFARAFPLGRTLRTE
jgi:hypothetical protein